MRECFKIGRGARSHLSVFWQWRGMNRAGLKESSSEEKGMLRMPLGSRKDRARGRERDREKGGCEYAGGKERMVPKMR